MPLLKRQRILFVDDNPILLACMGDYIEYFGYEVIRAGSGPQALRRLRRMRPDLILLDPLMGEKKGVKFLKQLSEHKSSRDCPVLIYTANADMEEFFRNVGVDDFVCKTGPEQELIRHIQNLLPSPQARQSAKKQPGYAGEVAVKKPAYHLSAEPPEEVREGEGSGRTILLGEDEPVIQKRLGRVLGGLGYVVLVAENGADLIARAQSTAPDIILSKEVLTGMNGSVAVATIQSAATTADIPVILYDDTDTLGSQRRRAALAGKVAVVSSSDVGDILPAVRRVLDIAG